MTPEVFPSNRVLFDVFNEIVLAETFLGVLLEESGQERLEFTGIIPLEFPEEVPPIVLVLFGSPRCWEFEETGPLKRFLVAGVLTSL